MRYLFTLLLLVHGLLHLIGCFKAFKWAEISQMVQPVSKAGGLCWGGAALLFMGTSLLFFLRNENWWMPALPALLVSQILIMLHWSDAKYGTLVNIPVLLVMIVAIFTWQFHRKFQQEADSRLQANTAMAPEILDESDLAGLPAPVQKYLRFSGAVGQAKVTCFKINFSGKIRQDEASAWMPFISEQYNFLQPAARLFFLKADMKHLPVAGYHRFVEGNAFMDIRLMSLFRVQYASGPEMGISETVTFFNDMCCMAPATLIDPRIRWLETSGNEVKAAFTLGDITIHATLTFDERGALINFVSYDRYATLKDNVLKQIPWSTPLSSYTLLKGHSLPGYAETIYEYPEGPFCYGTFSLEDVVYNPL